MICKQYKMFFAKFLIWFKDYCENSTISALRHIVAPKRHILERLFWILIIATSAGVASSLIIASYRRYETDPTVIALDKNYHNWRTPLPATTLCFLNKFNETSGRQLIINKWNVSDGATYKYYERLLSCLSNANYNNLQSCEEFVNDSNLSKLNLSELITEVNYDVVLERFQGKIFEQNEDVILHETLSEMGLCYSYNSLITRFFYLGSKWSNQSKTWDPPLCDNFQLFCYGKIINIRRPIMFYTHSPYDMPHLTGGVISQLNEESLAGYQALATVASTKVRWLRPSQRKCLFFDEMSSGEAPFYTYNLCLMNCRRSLALKLCRCVPFFYMKRDKEFHCGIKDIPCIKKYSTLLETLIDNSNTTRQRYPCKCLPECASVAYYQTTLSTEKIQERLLTQSKVYQYNTTHYRWEIDMLPRTQLKRDVIYSAEDLLVSWGGIAGFFVGCSLISGIEILYYITIKLIRFMCFSVSMSRNNKYRKLRLIIPLADHKNRNKI